MTPSDRVRRFCAATATRDVKTILESFASDAVYQNVGAPAYAGADAIGSALAAQFEAFPGPYCYELVSCAEQGSTVLTERIDILTTADGRQHRLPVMGVFEIRDDLIVRWRDYWDSRLLTRMLSGEDYTALVP